MFGDALTPFLAFALKELLPGRMKFAFAIKQAIMVHDQLRMNLAFLVNAPEKKFANMIPRQDDVVTGHLLPTAILPEPFQNVIAQVDCYAAVEAVYLRQLLHVLEEHL